MAEIVKTASQTPKVWTAQDFRERNARVDLEKKEKAKIRMRDELIPQFIGVLNDYYASDFAGIIRIEIIRKRTVSMDDYVINAIKEWAKPLGYGVDATNTAIYLVIPDEPETEKYEDS